jgi:hypothetical protein
LARASIVLLLCGLAVAIILTLFQVGALLVLEPFFQE